MSIVVNNDWVKNGGYFRVPVSDMDKLLIHLEEAVRERDHYKTLAESRWDGAIEASQERDALAAHVEALKAAAYSEGDGPGLRTNQQLRRVKALLDEGPGAASLARRDLLMKSAGIEDYLEYTRKVSPDEMLTLEEYSDALRRQSEDPK